MGQGGGLRTVGLALILLTLGLLALAVLLPLISPLRVDPVVYIGAFIFGVILAIGLILIGRVLGLPGLFLPPSDDATRAHRDVRGVSRNY